MSPKLLLLQARLADDPMMDHERRCFVSCSGLPPESVAVHDLCGGPPTLGELRRHDALTVGGSGDFYVSKGDLPGFEKFLDFLREVVERGYPTFASCFGFQSMVVALGGQVIHDPASTEVGTYRVTLTGEGKDDTLFRSLPESFMAQMGHKDRAGRLSDGLLNLASTERSRFQALRVPGVPIWATQFHPELDRDTNLDRFRYYMDGYAPFMSEEERREAEAERFLESPESSTLLARFLDLVFS